MLIGISDSLPPSIIRMKGLVIAPHRICT